MTTSIIVYRNPLEQAIWEGDHSMVFPFLMGAGAFFAVLVVFMKLLDDFGYMIKNRKAELFLQEYVSWVVSAIVSGAVFQHFNI